MGVYDPPAFHERTAQPKPEKGSSRTLLKHARAEVRRETKRETLLLKREEIEAEKQRRIECFKRDHGRCRAFGTRLQLVTDNVFKLAHCHHIVFRSHGGSDELFNRCILSPKAHDLLHKEGRLKIEGADAWKELTFTLLDSKGRIERVWVN